LLPTSVTLKEIVQSQFIFWNLSLYWGTT